jgi:hypothetical protein
MRARLAPWREQMTGLWQRIAGMTMERPGPVAATPAGWGGLAHNIPEPPGTQLACRARCD